MLKLNGKSYNYKKTENLTSEHAEKISYGLIAQDVMEVIPDLVRDDKSLKTLAINYDGFIPFLIEAFKEQQIQIEELKDLLVDRNIPTSLDDLDNIATASLAQNNPNPFSEETQIKYFVPKSAGEASIFIYNMNGVQLKEVSLVQRGASSINIKGSEFEAGMYLYALIVDGKELDTKRMILTK